MLVIHFYSQTWRMRSGDVPLSSDEVVTHVTLGRLIKNFLLQIIRSTYMFKSWPRGPITPRKNFARKSVILPHLLATPCFVGLLIQVKMLKIDFWPWYFIQVELKCFKSNINRRKALEMDHLSLLSLTLKTAKGDRDKRDMPSPVSISLFVLVFAFFQYFSIEFLGSM